MLTQTSIGIVTYSACITVRLCIDTRKGLHMYGVWQTGRHFSEQGLQPWAVSDSLSALEDWARTNIPVLGAKRFFFAEKTGSQTDLTDTNWTVVGHLYKDGIKAIRKDPERYVGNRSRPPRTWIHADYPDPTDEDWKRKTVYIDRKG